MTQTPTPGGVQTHSWTWTIRKNVFIVREGMKVLAWVAVIFFVAAILIDLVWPKTYSSTSRLVTQPTLQTSSPEQQQQAPVVDSTNYLDTQIQIVKSHAVLQRVVDEDHLADNQGVISTPMDQVQGLLQLPQGGVSADKAAEERAIDLLGKRIDASAVQDSFVLQIKVSSRDAGVSQQLASDVALAYLSASSDSHRRDLQNTQSSLQNLLKQQDKRVQQATQALSSWDAANPGSAGPVTSTRIDGAADSAHNETSTQTASPKQAERNTMEWRLSNEQKRYEELQTQLDQVQSGLQTTPTHASPQDLLDQPARATTSDGISFKYRILMYLVIAPLLGLVAVYVLYYWDTYRRSLPSLVRSLA